MDDLIAWLLDQVTIDEKIVGEHGGCDCHNIGHAPDCRARVLADCKAKRQIIDCYKDNNAKADELRRNGEDSQAIQTVCLALHWAVKRLAQPYADRPGYQESWRS